MFNFNWKLDWLPGWQKDNPTNIFEPAIYVGIGGGAVAAAAIVITFGWPFYTPSVQTGPRGTGMSVVEAGLQAGNIDPSIEEYYTEEPYVPGPEEPLMKDIADYENVQVLGDLTEDNFNRLMGAITQWVSPEQGCAYCHNEENYASDEVYTKVVSRRMIQMTQNLNESWPEHVGPAGVNCYTCHRGQNVPQEIWFRIDPLTEATSGWAAVQNRATYQSQSTSLPSDALQTYLVDYGQIAVHDLESRVDNEGTASIQDTERTYSLMNYFANSLGVNCVFCHNSRAFYDPEQHTPQWSVAMLGISMVLEMNNDYLIDLRDVYPEHRLGPIHQDAPKAACKTCHLGYNKPLQGLDMITDWPELAASGPPVYE
ncbi:MAG: photosynthetic reaction center cytochrome PufC [Pseudomonadota bacterium]